jgi:hypothetical protein
MSSNNRNRRWAGGVGVAVGAAFAAALAFSATAHADTTFVWPPVGSPTGIGYSWDLTTSYAPWFEQTQYDQDFSVFNAPDETFEGVVRFDSNGFGLNDYNVSVVQDISGNVPVGEQYNIFTYNDNWGVVYNDIGVTPEAFYTSPYGDLNFPTWFVEAVGPTFFEPSAPWLAGLYDTTTTAAATLPAAELPGLAADLHSLLTGLL